jgi:hypothetical protein
MGERSRLRLYIRIYSELIPHVNQEVSHVKWSAIRASDRQAVHGLIRVGVARWQTEDGKTMLHRLLHEFRSTAPCEIKLPPVEAEEGRVVAREEVCVANYFLLGHKNQVEKWPSNHRY